MTDLTEIKGKVSQKVYKLLEKLQLSCYMQHIPLFFPDSKYEYIEDEGEYHCSSHGRLEVWIGPIFMIFTTGSYKPICIKVNSDGETATPLNYHGRKSMRYNGWAMREQWDIRPSDYTDVSTKDGPWWKVVEKWANTNIPKAMKKHAQLEKDASLAHKKAEKEIQDALIKKDKTVYSAVEEFLKTMK